MKIADSLDMKGRLTLQTYNPAGQLITEVKANNFIVYTGRDLVAKLFLNQPIDPIQYLAVGTGTQPVDPINDTGLGQEVFRKPLKPLDLTKDLVDTAIQTIPTDGGSVNQQNRLVRVSTDLDFLEPSDQDYALTEAGLFNAPEGGTMYNRVVFPVITKSKDFKLTLVWEIVF